MSCQSWWCGGDVPIEAGRAPVGTRLLLSCGCAVERSASETGESVPVTFVGVACEAHRAARPDRLAPETRVRIDLLASLIHGNEPRGSVP